MVERLPSGGPRTRVLMRLGLEFVILTGLVLVLLAAAVVALVMGIAAVTQQDIALSQLVATDQLDGFLLASMLAAVAGMLNRSPTPKRRSGGGLQRLAQRLAARLAPAPVGA